MSIIPGPVPRSGFSGLFLEKPILIFVVGQRGSCGLKELNLYWVIVNNPNYPKIIQSQFYTSESSSHKAPDAISHWVKKYWLILDPVGILRNCGDSGEHSIVTQHTVYYCVYSAPLCIDSGIFQSRSGFAPQFRGSRFKHRLETPFASSILRLAQTPESRTNYFYVGLWSPSLA